MPFDVNTEGFSDQEKQTITALTQDVVALAKRAVEGAGNQARWFGANANSPALRKNLQAMHDYLSKKCTRITYVRKNVGQVVDQANVEASDYGQVIPNIMSTPIGFKKTETHVSKGIRVFAMNEYFNAVATNDREEMVNYIYHEISHKVLDTVDHEYGSAECRQLAIGEPGKALMNADNYGYFIAEIDAGG